MMSRKPVKIVSFISVLCLLAATLSSCDFKLEKNVTEPIVVSAAVDLNDAVFTFTYAELKGVLSPDSLAELFKDYDKLSDEVTIDLNYNQIFVNFNEDGDTFDKVMGLLSEDEKAALTANSEEALRYFIEHIQKAKDEKPTTEYDESFWTDDDSIKFSKDNIASEKELNTAVTFYKDIMLRKIDDRLLNGNAQTDEDEKSINDIIYLLGSDKACLLTMDDVVSVYSSLTPTYEQNSNKENVATEYFRTIKIVLKNNPESVKKAFTIRDKAPILEELKKGSDYFTVNDYNVEYNGCTITAVFNAVTDNLINVTYDKNMDITSDVTGTGSLEPLGTQTLTFNCTDRMYYTFGWPNEAK